MNNENIEKKSILQKDLNFKETMLVLGIVGLVVVYVMVFVYPGYSEYKASLNNLKQIETQINTYQSQIDNMPTLESQLANLTEEVKAKSKMLSHNMEDGMFLIGLSKIMDGVNVDLVGYTVEDPKPYNTFYAIPTTIEVRGNYNSIREVMEYLEQQKNMTQILDYSMETYIEEEKTESTTQQNSSTNGTIVTNIYDKIGWTLNGNSYHEVNCPTLLEEAKAFGGSFMQAAPPAGYTAADDCNPVIGTVTSQDSTSNESASGETTESPKSKGDIVANFKFIMYSSENPNIELKNDDFTTWKPGKWNPFKTTTR